MTNGSVVNCIRFTHCGRYVAKYYHTPEQAEEAFRAQDEAGYLWGAYEENQDYYISEACEVMPEELADWLFEHDYRVGGIGNNIELQQWLDNDIDNTLESLHQQFMSVMDLNETDQLARAAWDWLVLGANSLLDFDDNHWENLGIRADGELVPIDYDPFNYECAGDLLRRPRLPQR